MAKVKPSSVVVDRVEVSAAPGATLHAAVREAIVMALVENRRVVVTHNARTVTIVTINPQTLVNDYANGHTDD